MCCRSSWHRCGAGRPREGVRMRRERVVAAMSGGVDSAVAAARCVAAGHEVIGISLRLLRGTEGHCCSLDDFHDARALADRLGVPHYVFDMTEPFERHVTRPFVAEYLAGRTPNPCARCNEHVKFGPLWSRARAPGHAPPAALREGAIVDDAGRELGRHGGVHRFTVGQRRGLGLGGGARRYVTGLDAATGTVRVAAGEGPGARGLVARGVSWAAGVPLAAGASLAVR